MKDLEDLKERHEAELLTAYWHEVDAEMERLFGVNTGDVFPGAFRVALAQVQGQSAAEFAREYGIECGLFLMPET